MEPRADVSIAGVDPEIGTCLIVLPDGVRIGPVDGQLLEAAFTLSDARTLVILSHDCMFEEALSIYLLGPDAQIEDRIHTRVMYTAGFFKMVRLCADGLEFNLYSTEQTYRLKISEPRWRWRLPRGWIYGGWQMRRPLSLCEVATPSRRALKDMVPS